MRLLRPAVAYERNPGAGCAPLSGVPPKGALPTADGTYRRVFVPVIHEAGTGEKEIGVKQYRATISVNRGSPTAPGWLRGF